MELTSKRVSELSEIWTSDLSQLYDDRCDKPLRKRLEISAQVFCEIIRRLRDRVQTEPYFDEFNKLSDFIVTDLRCTTLNEHIEFRLRSICELIKEPKEIFEEILTWAIRYLSIRVDRMCLLMTAIELDCFVDFVHFLMWTNVHNFVNEADFESK